MVAAMRNFRQVDRATGFLLPPSVDEWLPERHLVRFIVEVIEHLDLSAMVKAYRGSGSASYHPSVLLGLLVYGYATGVFSSRALERATYDSVAFRFIAANDHPDHDTIATFRRRFLAQIEGLFVQLLMLAREAGMVKLGTVALDGTKVHANASRHSALSYEHAGKIEAQLKAEVDELMALAEVADTADVPDGMSIPEELARRAGRLQCLAKAKAKAKIEARARERYEREQAEYRRILNKGHPSLQNTTDLWEVRMNSLWSTWSTEERDFSRFVRSKLADVHWAQSLLHRIDVGGGIVEENQDLLFELRFAFALHLHGIDPQYEISGEGQSNIDFGFRSAGQYWRAELMRLNETQAAKDATYTRVTADGIQLSSRHLSTDSEDNRQSDDGETLKAVQRICNKCERTGNPHKFPLPNGSYHMLLIDFRQFLGGGDEQDKIHIGLGGEFLARDEQRMFWEGKLISGVFNTRTTVRGAKEARERVHFLGFVDERMFVSGEIAHTTEFIANPHLFDAGRDAISALNTWPFRPSRLLNKK